MKSPPTPAFPPAPGLYRLAAAGLVNPCADHQPQGPADLLVELGPANDPAGPARSIRILPHDPAAPSTHATPIDLRHAVLIPGMVNAHTHLDLTHMGPQPHDPAEGFVAWVDRVRASRLEDPDAIRASVRLGIDLSLRAGVVAVGDIAGAPKGHPRTEPFEALADSPLRGISYTEFFAMGSAEPAALARIDAFLEDALPALRGARLGLQPHAPNTVSIPAYRRAAELAKRHDLPLATHLAETPEEREFIAHATGPHRAFIERFGFWQDDILEHIGKGKSPVEHLAPVLEEASRNDPRLVAAHVNDTGPNLARTLEILAATGTNVAYCPRASAYFSAHEHFGPHRYRDMLAAGINVCLATDSIVNLPQGVEAPDGPGLSVLDEARFLYARDATDPLTLLRMITTHGCLALGLDGSLCSLAPTATPLGLVAIDVTQTPPNLPPAERVLRATSGAQLLAIAT